MASVFRPCVSQSLSFTRFLSPIIVTTRTLASQKVSAALDKARNYEDDVYLLNYRPPPSHSFTEALAVLRAYALSNFDETVELHLKINMGEKKNKVQAFRGIVMLPKTYGLQKTLLVFAEGDAAVAAKEGGADIVGGQELFEQIKKGGLKFDQCLSTMEMIDRVKSLQRILREKMPTTRRGTATDDIVTAIKTYKQGHSYKCDKNGFLNVGIGKLSFQDQEIKNNATSLIQAVHSHKISSKGKFITRIMMSSTHGPGLLLHLKELEP